MRPKRHNPKLYRSGFEERFQQLCLDEFGWTFPYETDRIKFTIPESTHTYTPDFTVAKNIYIETKGIWSTADRKKAKLIAEQHPTITILYVLYRNQKLSKKSTTTYLDWAKKAGLDACLFSNRDHWIEFIKRSL